jgi:hypothetical protein
MLQAILSIILCPLLVAQEISPPVALTDASQSSMTAPAASVIDPLPKFITIPKDTEIELISLEAVSSAAATKGQLVRLAVAKDVLVKGLVVIPKGMLATGVVSRLTKGVPGKRDGFLRVVPRILLLNNGKTVRLREYRSGEYDCDPIGPCWAMYTFLAPIILIGLVSEKVLDSDEKPPGKDDAINACESLIWHGYTNRTKIQSVDLPATKSIPESAVPCKLASESKKAFDATPQAGVATDNPIPQSH